MPTYEVGDLWCARVVYCVSTNSTVKKDGHLVMGRGAAYQAARRYPDLALKAGGKIERTCGSGGTYGYMPVLFRWGEIVSLFQVKHHWRERASLDLIRQSAAMLGEEARLHPRWTFHLNYPGIGNGGLPEEEVAPLLVDLPNNVHVWKFPERM